MADDGDIQTFLSDIETEIDAIDDFPQEVERPVISELGKTDPVLSLLVSGPMKVPDLKAYCEDLKDMEELFKQTEGTGVDVYTHGEMLPAFLSPTVATVLVEKFDIKPIGTVEKDISAMTARN